ncbi:MAG: LacI family DNA-binding transcriptional regulator [Pseudonocardia sediminis]
MADRATLVTVARAAGVSRQTVSNVLNSPELVSPDTLERVRRVIDEQGYRANRAARQMRTRRAQVIGLRIEAVRDGSNGVVLERFLHALTASAEHHDQRTMLFTATDDESEIRAYRDLEASAGVDAFVLSGTHHGDVRTHWLRERGLPFVTFGRPWGAEDTHPWVDVDGAAGTAAATEHLLRRGHRRIAFVGWPDGSGVGDDRRAGWRRTLRAAGLPPGPDAAEPDSFDGGHRAAAELLAPSDPPTAFVCASDSLALGLTAELRRRGIPWDAVIGFDDTPTAGFVGLSSVRQPVADAAAACVRQLQTVLDGGVPEPDLLSPELVVRHPD